MSNRKRAMVVVGPTASGKTELAVQLAKEYDGEIISADSMQIYKGMDIGTAKPTLQDMQGIPHHLLGFLESDQSFSVAEYVKLANEKISDVFSRGKLPIVVGGTGLYISSLIDNINFDSSVEDKTGLIRKRLLGETALCGNKSMLDKLYKVDNQTASSLHENNINRIIRALEVFEITGVTLSRHKELSRFEESAYDWCEIGLDFKNRELLYDRINRRVDIMVEKGLVEEAREIWNKSKFSENKQTSKQAIGYKELNIYFDGKQELKECILKIKQATRNYAKRQLTWFRRDERICWVYQDNNMKNNENINICKKIW